MARLCERPGCSQPGDVRYGIDPDRLIVWIEGLDPAWPDRPGTLCRRHADAMVVPVRWTLDDRREVVPRLFRVAAPVEPPPSTVRRPRRHRIADVVQLELEEADREPDCTGSPWRPVFDPDDDLDGLLDATGPLLARAFSGRRRVAETR